MDGPKSFSLRIGIAVALAFFAAFALLGAGCTGQSDHDDGDDLSEHDDDTNAGGDDDDAPSEPAGFHVATVTVDTPPVGNPLARRIFVSTAYPLSLSGFVHTTGEPGYSPSRPVAGPNAKEHEFWFYGLLEDREFEYVFYPAGRPDQVLARGSFSTPALPSDSPDLVRTTIDPAGTGDWIVAWMRIHLPVDHVTIQVFDRRGRVRFHHDLTTFADFLRVQNNGDFILTLTSHLVGVHPDGTEFVVSPVRLNEPVFTPSHHQFYLDPADPSGAMVVFNRMGPGVECDLITPTYQALGDGIAQIDENGDEVWRWTVFAHQDVIAPEAMDPENCGVYFWGPDTYDWTHANAVIPVPGQNAYLVSLRNVSRIVKVNRATSQIEWQMGEGLDFTWVGAGVPVQDRWFYFQHDSIWLEGPRLLLFDNANCRYGGSCLNGPWSRALELEFDETARTVSTVWEYRVPFALSQGNVQRHPNGNTLIGTGSSRMIVELPPGGIEGEQLIELLPDVGMVRAAYTAPMWDSSDPPGQ